MKKTKVLSLILVSLLLLMGCSSKNASEIPNVEKYIKLGQYKELKYTPQAVPVSEDEINAAIENTLSAYKEEKAINDRPVQDGDLVNIDYKGLLNDKAFDGGTAEGYDLKIGSNTFIPGFEEKLIGAKIGETVNLNLSFPKEYHSAELAGKEVVFVVTVNSIKEESLPELTDAFVKENLGFNTASEYKESVRIMLQEEADFPDKIALLEMATSNAEIIEYPKDKLDKTLADMKAELEQNATSANMKPEEFIKNYLHMTQEEFDAESKTRAEKSIAMELTVSAIEKAENLALTDEEYKKTLDVYTKRFNLKSSDELVNMYGEETIRKQARYEKIMDFLAENAIKN